METNNDVCFMFVFVLRLSLLPLCSHLLYNGFRITTIRINFFQIFSGISIYLNELLEDAYLLHERIENTFKARHISVFDLYRKNYIESIEIFKIWTFFRYKCFFINQLTNNSSHLKITHKKSIVNRLFECRLHIFSVDSSIKW